MRTIIRAAICAVSLVFAGSAAAQSSMGNMQGMGAMPGMSGDMKGMAGMKGMEGMSPVQHEQMMAMQRMNEQMTAVTDPDRAFAKKMIAHHEGAIAMSEIEIRNGKDAEAKRLAEAFAKENRMGVSELKAFLAKH